VMTNSKRYFRFLSSLLFLLVLMGRGNAGGLPSELKVDVTLVWGANEQLKGKNLKPAGKGLQEKLSKTLKWEHYYEISDKSFALNGTKAQRARMSDKCVVEVKRIGEREVNVKLIGEGKVVVDRRQSLEKDDSVVLGGPCKDESAWFVVLRFR
jgi:hypothetical protein